MALAESWHVRSRSRECSVTRRPFADGETIVTALYPDPESSGYLRRDFSLEAWTDHASEVGPAFSFWKTTFAAPAAQVPASRKINSEELLHQLVVEDQDHTENTRYILAVMLERQKILRETDHQRTPHGILRVYEHRKTGEVYLIRDPNIPLDQVESIQQEVMEMLASAGRPPAAADEPASDEPAAGEPAAGEPAADEPAAGPAEDPAPDTPATPDSSSASQ